MSVRSASPGRVEQHLDLRGVHREGLLGEDVEPGVERGRATVGAWVSAGVATMTASASASARHRSSVVATGTPG